VDIWISLHWEWLERSRNVFLSFVIIIWILWFKLNFFVTIIGSLFFFCLYCFILTEPHYYLLNCRKLENVIFIHLFFQHLIFFIYVYCVLLRWMAIVPRWNVIRVVTLKLFARIPGRERTVLLASLSEHVRPYQAPAFFLFGRRCS